MKKISILLLPLLTLGLSSCGNNSSTEFEVYYFKSEDISFTRQNDYKAFLKIGNKGEYTKLKRNDFKYTSSGKVEFFYESIIVGSFTYVPYTSELANWGF